MRSDVRHRRMRWLRTLYKLLLCCPLLAITHWATAAEATLPPERTLAVKVEASGGLFAFAAVCDVPKDALSTLFKMDARAAGEFAEAHGVAFTQDDFKRDFARGMEANPVFIRGATPESRARNCPEIAAKVRDSIAGGAAGHAYK
jgi:hypothetical protein